MCAKVYPLGWVAAMAIALGIFLAPGTAAYADIVQTYNLNVDNGVVPNGPTYGTVTVTISGNDVDIEFFTSASIFSGLGLTPGPNFGIDKIALMSTAAIPANAIIIGNGGGTWSSDNNTNMDGYGDMTWAASVSPNNARSNDVTVDFTLAGASLATFTSLFSPGNNTPPVNFVAHIADWAGGQSAFFGNGQENVVPEPSTMVLALTSLGALGFGGLTRRLRRRTAQA